MKVYPWLFFILYSQKVFGSAFLGDAGVVSNNLNDLSLNPANIAHIQDSQIGAAFSPIVWKSLNAQFQGLEPNKKVGIFPELPSFVSPDNTPFRVGRSSKNQLFGFSIVAFPPLDLSSFARRTLIEDIPLFAFRQEDKVAAKINRLRLKGLANLVGAYRLGDLTLGGALKYGGAQVAGRTYVQVSGDELFSFKVDASTLTLDWGMRYEIIPRTLDIGISGPLYEITDADVSIDTGIISQSQKLGPSNATPFRRVLAGIRYKFSKRALAHFDLEYVKGLPEQGIALDDLRVGTREVYDTLSPRLGLRYIFQSDWIVMGGYRYQPARYGDGDREQNGKIGFGALDLMLIYLGLEPLTPYHMFGFGTEIKPWRNTRSTSDEDGTDSPRFPWTISMGVTFRTASRGVGPDGTIPGTYTENRIAIPIGVTYRY